MPSFTTAELAARVDARLEGDPDRRLDGVAPLGEAGPTHLAFYTPGGSREGLSTTRAGGLLVGDDVEIVLDGTTLLHVDDPRLAFAELVSLFHDEPAPDPGVHPTAVLGRGVRLGDGVGIGPYVVIEAGAIVGSGSRLGASSFVGEGARLGDDCRIGRSVSILRGAALGDRVVVQDGTRIATDGFGYAPTRKGARKIPQVGGCVIGDDVEIGANCTIDRGALGDTRIGARSKLDNLVHVGHNVDVGEDCMIVAQVGIAGSTTIEAGAALAGQAGIAGHLTVGAGARIAAQAGVIGDVPAGATYGGYPARPHKSWLRASAATLRLPAVLRRLAALERAVGVESDGRHDEGEEDR